jgi:hypothetical protein
MASAGLRGRRPQAASPLQPPSPPSPSQSSLMSPPPPPIEDTTACGIRLRRDLVAGTLSQEAQQALVRMSQVRKGLVSDPVPLSVRKAIVNARLNPGLKSVLISELLQTSSAPPRTNPGPPRRSPTMDSPDVLPDHLRPQQSMPEPASPVPKKVFRMRRSKPSEQLGRPASTHEVGSGSRLAHGNPDRPNAISSSSLGPTGNPNLNAPSSSRGPMSAGTANSLGSRDEWPGGVHGGTSQGS